MAANARLLNVVWQRLVALPAAPPPPLPDELWWHVGLFLAAYPTDDSTNYGGLSLAICEAHLDLTTHPDPKTKHRAYVITHQHKNASDSGADADAVAVRHLTVGKDANLYCPSHWRGLFRTFANVVSLDLSRVVDHRACEAVRLASRCSRHIGALALPSEALPESLAQDVIENTAAALQCWCEANGGLRFLSLGRVIYHRAKGHCVLEAVARSCPRIEFLYAPEGAVLRDSRPEVYAALWRSCLNLRDSNCYFPVSTRQDFEALVAHPKPQLVDVAFNVVHSMWAYSDPSTLEAFALAFPSLKSIRLRAHAQQYMSMFYAFVRHSLVSCPHLESVVLLEASNRKKWSRLLADEWQAAMSTGLLALLRCSRIKCLSVEPVLLGSDTLVDVVNCLLLTASQSTRSIVLTVVHFDWFTLRRFLQFLQTVSIAQVTNMSFVLRVRSCDTQVSERNRACDEAFLRTLVRGFKQKLPDDLVRLQIDLVSAQARSDLVVAAVNVFVNTGTMRPLDGVFIDGARAKA